MLARLDVPQTTGHVSGAGYNLRERSLVTLLFSVILSTTHLIVIEKPTAGQVAGVAGQFPRDAHVTLAVLEAVNRTDVVQATARDETA